MPLIVGQTRPVEWLRQRPRRARMLDAYSIGSHGVLTMEFRKLILLIGILVALLLSGCEPKQPQQNDIRVELVVDNTRSVYTYNRAISVQQFLDEQQIERSPLDRIVPQLYVQITDGMTITIVRVVETEECRQEEIPFGQQQRRTGSLAPGETQLIQPGVSGLREVCDTVTMEDGVVRGRNPKSSTPLRDPVDEIVYVGVADRLEPVPIEGTLVYISGAQAYLMKTSSTLRQPLTIDGNLDGRVFELSEDGRQLLFTRQTDAPDDLPFSNELWVILDINNPTETDFRLPITNVLTAAWRPGSPYTFSYSSATPDTGGFQGWRAYNDLWLMTIDSQRPDDDGRNRIEPIIEENFSGSFAQWGTRFAWSPDGEKLAYAKADGVGLVDLENGEFLPFSNTGLAFPYFSPAISESWVWQPLITWSRDSEWVATTVHGAPFGGETPNDSIVFNVGVFQTEGTMALDSLIGQAGIWANPAYSPVRVNALGFDDYQVAYLQARDWQNSVGAYYDLVVADRDGSNPRPIFPSRDQVGLRPLGYQLNSVQANFDGEFAWSPSGRQIVIVFQGNLWLIEVSTGLARLITDDGSISSPRWTS